MGRLSIDQLKPGMVLGEDLKASNGRVLLGKGMELTEKNFRLLKMWGIMDAEIIGVSAKDIESEPMEKFDPVIIKEAMEKTRRHFRLCNLNHPGALELFRLCTLRNAKSISHGHNGQDAGTSNNSPIGAGITRHEVKLAYINPKDLLQDGIKLPSLPDIFMQIQDIINNPYSSAHAIANAIGKDSGLAACLLKLVNSAFYGYPSKIDSLSRAVTIVGIKQLTTLAMGVSVINLFKDIPQDLIDLRSFWKHSVGCGIIARALAKYKNISNNERLFVGGLLHDIGRMIIYGYLPQHARAVLLRAFEDHSPLQSMELEIMGFTHQYIGALLLRKWRFPITLESMVLHHHKPMASRQPMDSAIVHIADIMANALAVGSSGERLVPALNVQAWEILGIPASILSPTITQLDSQINEVIKLFFTEE